MGWQRNYETAAMRPYGLEFGGGGYIASVDGKAVPPPIRLKTVDDGRVLQGWAALYNKPVLNNGRIKVISPGAFDAYLASGAKVGFWIDHDPNRCVCDTTSGLELHSDERGLAFRVRLPETSLGQMARQLVNDHEYFGVSVGFTYKNNVTTINGEEVSLIKDAWLQEVSLVREGAIDQAFGILTEPSGTLKDSVIDLDRDGAFRNLMRALQRLHEQDHR